MRDLPVKSLLAVLLLASCALPRRGEPGDPRIRLIIETDAGGDPDDERSLVRFLLYANEWDVEGIIANRPTPSTRPISAGLVFQLGDEQGLGAELPQARARPWTLWVDTFRPEMEGKRWYHRFSALTAAAGGFDVERDVRRGHGPLGALYPTNTTHPQKEGDTMSFLYLVPTGMNDPNEPEWGSWGGRYGPQDDSGRAYYWANQKDEWEGTTSRDHGLARWAVDLQNDFRARLDWCVKPPSEANHPPQARVEGSLRRTVAPGARVEVSAAGSRDPDGDALSNRWITNPEAGSYRGLLAIQRADTPEASFVAPLVDGPQTIHLVLAVTDGGTPALSRYRRLIVTVDPAVR